MYRPKAYDPQDGYMFQIFCRNVSKEWESCDYAEDRHDRRYLLGEYCLAYGAGFEFKTVLLPRRYWPVCPRARRKAETNQCQTKTKPA